MKKILLSLISISLVLTLFACSVKPENGKTVLKVGGKNINYDYYRYVFLNTRDDLDGGDRSVWASDIALQLELTDSVLATIRHNRAIELLADEYGVSLSSDEKKEIRQWVSDQKAALGDNWDESLKNAYLTEYMITYLKEFETLWDKIFNYITNEMNGIIRISDNELIDIIPERFTRILFVMIPKDSENALDTAREVRQKALDGEDFRELAAEYNDPDAVSYNVEDGYYFVEGEILPDVESEIKELEIGEISGIIDTDTGYFIIKRLEIDSNYVDKNLEEFRTNYYARYFNDLVEKIESDIETVPTDYYSELTVFTVE